MAAKPAQECALSTRIPVLVEDIHQFISSIQRPKLKDASWAQSIFRHSRRLESRIAELHKLLADRHESFSRPLDELAVSLRAYCLELGGNRNRNRLNARRAYLALLYEDLLAQLPDLGLKGLASLTRTSHLKPMNYVRNLFHAISGMTALFLYEFLLTRPEAIVCTLVAAAALVTMEGLRRHSVAWNEFFSEKIFRVLAHPSERHRVTGSTYFVLALVVITILFPKPAVEVAILILALADPAASISGRLWGKRKLYRNKSYVGSGVFFTVGWMSAMVFLTIKVNHLSTSHVVAAALIIAATGTMVEVLSNRLDDNLTIPVVCAFTASLLL